MAWRNMRGGWTQNATQGFKTRALARAACGHRPIDPNRPHLRWYVGRVEKVTKWDGGHYWQVSHFVKVVTVEATLPGGITLVFTASGLYGPYACVLISDNGEYHHSYHYNDPEFLREILAVGAK